MQHNGRIICIASCQSDKRAWMGWTCTNLFRCHTDGKWSSQFCSWQVSQTWVHFKHGNTFDRSSLKNKWLVDFRQRTGFDDCERRWVFCPVRHHTEKCPRSGHLYPATAPQSRRWGVFGWTVSIIRFWRYDVATQLQPGFLLQDTARHFLSLLCATQRFFWKSCRKIVENVNVFVCLCEEKHLCECLSRFVHEMALCKKKKRGRDRLLNEAKGFGGTFSSQVISNESLVGNHLLPLFEVFSCSVWVQIVSLYSPPFATFWEITLCWFFCRRLSWRFIWHWVFGWEHVCYVWKDERTCAHVWQASTWKQTHHGIGFIRGCTGSLRLCCLR